MANILRLASGFGKGAARAGKGVARAARRVVTKTPKVRIKGNPPRKQGFRSHDFEAPFQERMRKTELPQRFPNKKGVGKDYRFPEELANEELLIQDYELIAKNTKLEGDWRRIPTVGEIGNEMKLAGEMPAASDLKMAVGKPGMSPEDSWKMLQENAAKMTARGKLMRENFNTPLNRALAESDAMEQEALSRTPGEHQRIVQESAARRFGIYEKYGGELTRAAQTEMIEFKADQDFMRAMYGSWGELDEDTKLWVVDLNEVHNEGAPLRKGLSDYARDLGSRITRGVNSLRNPSGTTGSWDDPYPNEWLDEAKGTRTGEYWERVNRVEGGMAAKFRETANSYRTHVSNSAERLRESLATYVFRRGVSGGRLVGTSREMEGIRRVVGKIANVEDLIRYTQNRLGSKISWVGQGWLAGQGIAAVKDWVLSEAEKDVDVPSTRGNNIGRQNAIKNPADYGGSELTQPPNRERGGVSSTGLAPEEGGGTKKSSEYDWDRPKTDEEIAAQNAEGDRYYANREAGRRMAKTPNNPVSRVISGAMQGGVAMFNLDSEGLKDAGDTLTGAEEWEDKAPGDDFENSPDLDTTDLDQRIDAIADTQGGGDPGSLNYRNGRKGRLKGSVLNTTAPFAPLGVGDNNAVKSSPIYGDNALSDVELAYRDALGYKTPMSGTDISEKLNDPRGRKLQTSIPTNPAIESADQFHPNHYYEPAVDPMTGVMKLILRKRNRDDALSELTYSTSDKRLRTGTRDAELLVPLTFDTRYMPALPAGVDIFTLADGAPKPYIPSQPRMGPQLYDAPELVGVGWDERNPPPDPRTVTMSTSSTVGTSGADIDFSRKSSTAEGVRPDLRAGQPVATESSAETPSRLARRGRDSYNAANQMNPFSVNVPKAPMPSEPIPSSIGATNPLYG